MNDLERAVFAFSRLVSDLKDSDLDQPWVWGDYNEGVRFAFFRTLEDLNILAASLATERSRSNPFSTAQRLLAQYHAAYRDLQAIVLDISDLQAEQPPVEGEWPLRTALLHIVQAERTFFAINLDAIERQRTQDGRPQEMTDEAWEAFWSNDPFGEIKASGAFSEILAYHDHLHTRIMTELVGVNEIELDIPVTFWESQPMPVRFRLGRFTSHLRQHTVQIEKALPPLGLAPVEAKRLLRIVYGALADVEGCLLGAPELAAACTDLVHQIELRTGDISAVLKRSIAKDSK